MTLVAVPGVLAHESRIYQIEHDTFQFTVGSLNEPIAVDDKTGVELIVARVAAPAMGVMAKNENMASHDHENNGAVIGLEKTLKVEISAGDKKKTMELTPIYGKEGSYRANFIPTVQTTYTYRFFGTVHDTPVDVSFSCNPAGHPVSPEDTNQVKLGDEVTQLKRSGAFGCPVAKADLGFPEPSVSENDLAGEMATVRSEAKSAAATGMTGVGAGVLGLIIGAAAWIKRR